MRRAVEVVAAGRWPDGEAAATVTLAYDDRHRRRIRLIDDAGSAFMLDLAEATRMGDGDGLRLEGGGWVRVRAAEEAVADMRCRSLTETARLAWHVGNRHIPVQVLEDGTLRIRDDHVIVAMARRLGASVEQTTAPFAPEGGAYDGPAAGHGHDHGHDHHHPHDHDHPHDHSHAHARHHEH